MTMSAVVAIGLIAATPQIEVRDWPTPGGWQVVQHDEGCALGNTYYPDGRQPVTIIVIPTEEVIAVSLSSPDWSAVAGQEYEITYRLGSGGYTVQAVGFRDEADRGFTAYFAPDFLDRFAAASGLHVSRGEAVVTNISLRNSAAAVAAVRRCSNFVSAARAEQARREQRWDYIERDPFAPPAPPPPAPGADPMLIVNPTWARQVLPEFPERAMARGIESGRVELECQVQPNGSLTDCRTVDESPADAGFGQAAIAAARRSRVSPRTVDGAPAGARVRWTSRFATAAAPTTED